eukprot:755796-Hanusia_phi.AAC.7
MPPKLHNLHAENTRETGQSLSHIAPHPPSNKHPHSVERPTVAVEEGNQRARARIVCVFAKVRLIFASRKLASRLTQFVGQPPTCTKTCQSCHRPGLLVTVAVEKLRYNVVAQLELVSAQLVAHKCLPSVHQNAWN